MYNELKKGTAFYIRSGVYGQGPFGTFIVDDDDIGNDIIYCHNTNGDWCGTLSSKAVHEAINGDWCGTMSSKAVHEAIRSEKELKEPKEDRESIFTRVKLSKEVKFYSLTCTDASWEIKESFILYTDLITAFSLWQSRTTVALNYTRVALIAYVKNDPDGIGILLQEFTR